jgi:beta-galactosidase/beta-glucuronidase
MELNVDTIPTPQPPRATTQDGTYPRPQLVRENWFDLSGPWGFAFDDDNAGLEQRWFENGPFDRQIIVPFPPESAASGIADTDFHPVVWYRRALTRDDLAASGFRTRPQRLILNFGAVDYRASVWIDGSLVGTHEGGHTSFSFDITDALDPARDGHDLVVRAEDHPWDLTQPRGKQEWLREPHRIWYDRTTGIWQPVWLEAVAPTSISTLHWRTDAAADEVRMHVTFSTPLRQTATVTVAVSFDGHPLVTVSAKLEAGAPSHEIVFATPLGDRPTSDRLWSPETPNLFDATITVSGGGEVDVVSSYFGVRDVATDDRSLLLNGEPYYLRSVLSQGYWPESHLAAPSAGALRAEVELIKSLGFNAARLHQKIEDPRLLFWSDVLGLLIWEEMPSAYEFTTTSVQRTIREWMEAVERDRSHPSIVAWVPLNESWGVDDIATSPAMQEFARSLFSLTKALDPTRLVSSNDGWEQTESDIWTVHDYEASGDVVRTRYSDDAARDDLFVGEGPGGRVVRISPVDDRPRPVMLTEFGGIQFSVTYRDANAWGYSAAAGADDFRERLSSLVAAVHDSGFLSGYCYTQLTDTQQEANGLTDENRVPKLPVEEIARIMRGEAS